MNSREIGVTQEIVYSGRILNVVHKRIQLSLEKTVEYEVLHRSDIVIIIPVLPSGEVVLIKQFRASLEQDIWEFPAGSIEIEESPVEAARRELHEETGYQSEQIRLLRSFYIAPHFCDEKAFVFIANVVKCDRANLQEKEIITSHIFKQEILREKYTSGEILDAKTIVAYHAFLSDVAQNQL